MRPIIVKLARMLTDCMDAKMGLVRMDENRWEYKMLDALLTDGQAELMLKMGRRKPTTSSTRSALSAVIRNSQITAARTTR